MMDKKLSKTCEVSCQNKFVKLVKLVGFIIKVYGDIEGFHGNTINLCLAGLCTTMCSLVWLPTLYGNLLLVSSTLKKEAAGPSTTSLPSTKLNSVINQKTTT
jgi:hypothetical protein